MRRKLALLWTEEDVSKGTLNREAPRTGQRAKYKVAYLLIPVGRAIVAVLCVLRDRSGKRLRNDDRRQRCMLLSPNVRRDV